MPRRPPVPLPNSRESEAKTIAKQASHFELLCQALEEQWLRGERSLQPVGEDDNGVVFESVGRLDRTKLREMYNASKNHGGSRKRQATEVARERRKLTKPLDKTLRSSHVKLHDMFAEATCPEDGPCASRVGAIRSHREACDDVMSAVQGTVEAWGRIIDASAEGEGGRPDFVHTLREYGLSFKEIAFVTLRLGGAITVRRDRLADEASAAAQANRAYKMAETKQVAKIIARKSVRFGDAPKRGSKLISK